MAESAVLVSTARHGHSRIWIGGGIVVCLFATALFAPWLAPHNPLEQDLINGLLPPFWSAEYDSNYLLGTDSLGRDVLSRLIFGARVAVIVALVAATLAALLGTILGLLAGYYGGAFDTVISRLVDIWMAFPPVLLSIVLVAVIGSGLHAVIFAIVIIDWTRFCRVVRSETLVQREKEYIASAVTIGLGRWKTLWREIFPNVLPLLVTLLTMEMGIAIIVEAILSFVGLSVSSDQATWGGLIQEGRQYVHDAWWVMIMPMICIIVVVSAFNALGDGLRSVLDPVMRR